MTEGSLHTGITTNNVVKRLWGIRRFQIKGTLGKFGTRSWFFFYKPSQKILRPFNPLVPDVH